MADNSHALATQLHLRAEAATNLRRYQEAQELALRALTIDPEYGDGHASLGRALLGLQKYKQAEAHFRQALRIDPTSFWYMNGLAVCLKVQGKLKAAGKIADQLVASYPLTAEAFMTRGGILHDRKLYREACNHFRTALSLSPESARARRELGDSLLALKKFAEADSQYRLALQLEPNSAHALNNLGVCLENQARLKDAALLYKAALLADPSLAVAKQNTKSALDRYLHWEVGGLFIVLGFLIKFIVEAVSAPNRQTLFALGIVLSMFSIIVAVFLYLRRRAYNVKKADLDSEDPQLLQIYETIKRDKGK